MGHSRISQNRIRCQLSSLADLAGLRLRPWAAVGSLFGISLAFESAMARHELTTGVARVDWLPDRLGQSSACFYYTMTYADDSVHYQVNRQDRNRTEPS